MKTETMPTPNDCRTCLFMATHEDCEKDGGCLNTKEDWAAYRASPTREMPPMRFRHWVESNPMEQMSRLHALQASGARNIVLGPGEAEVNVKQSPKQVSRELHDTAEQCGYYVSRLSAMGADGVQFLTVQKDFGPFMIEWVDGQLVRIKQGDQFDRVFWSVAEAY